MNKVQLMIACVVTAAWLIGVLVAAVDGLTVLRVTTPMMTTVVGFLFTAKATAA